MSASNSWFLAHTGEPFQSCFSLRFWSLLFSSMASAPISMFDYRNRKSYVHENMPLFCTPKFAVIHIQMSMTCLHLVINYKHISHRLLSQSLLDSFNTFYIKFINPRYRCSSTMTHFRMHKHLFQCALAQFIMLGKH